ncbi:MAG TPA: hypothetical protein VGD36_10820 [Xanthobacteraceae bacterium]|jgi:hypothetical protein
MRLAALLAAAFIATSTLTAAAEVEIVKDPDAWVDGALKQLTAGKTDDFARSYLKLIDKPGSFDSFAGGLRVLSRIGAPAFVDKVVDQKYGTALREVVYVAQYQRTDYIYFKFTIKKHRDGWMISNFKFENETGDLFPKGFLTPG